MEAAKVANPRGTCLLTAVLTVVLGMAAAPAVHAQGSGVVFEPGTPSDKEYAIPLEEARRDAGGGSPGRDEAAAFGIGLSRKGRPRGPAARADSDARRGAGERRWTRASRQGARGGTEESESLGERLADAEDAGVPALWTLGPMSLVLLPALIVGLLLVLRGRGRRRAAAT